MNIQVVVISEANMFCAVLRRTCTSTTTCRSRRAAQVYPRAISEFFATNVI